MKAKIIKTTLRMLPAIGLLGCITINLYFPEAEILDAAATIVDEVRPPDVAVDDVDLDGGGAALEGKASPSTSEAPAGRDQSSASASTARLRIAATTERFAGGLLAAHAAQEKKVKIDISTPVIRKIRETLKERYPKLAPFYEKGAVGESLTGYIVERETDELDLREKRALKSLLKQENDDRKNLYAEIVRANEIDPEKTNDIAAIFATQWIEKSKEGWWIEKSKGVWERKKKEKD